MIVRISLQLLFLPVLAVALPLMYLAAWLHEAISDLAPRAVPQETRDRRHAP